MKGRWIHLKDVELDKHGRVIARRPCRQSVSDRLRQKHSKRVKVARKLTRV